jgi:hypothetical protein
MTLKEKQFVQEMRTRFIDERTRGYRDPSGEHHPPVARPTAQRAWGRHRPKIIAAMSDPEVRRKLKLDQ